MKGNMILLWPSLKYLIFANMLPIFHEKTFILLLPYNSVWNFADMFLENLNREFAVAIILLSRMEGE